MCTQSGSLDNKNPHFGHQFPQTGQLCYETETQQVDESIDTTEYPTSTRDRQNKNRTNMRLFTTQHNNISSW